MYITMGVCIYLWVLYLRARICVGCDIKGDDKIDVERYFLMSLLNIDF